MFFDRPDSGELAVLVHMELNQRDRVNDLREFEELVLSAGGDPAALVTGSRAAPQAKYFIGTGKLEELQNAVEQNEAEVVIFNHELSPSQERNLEAALQCRVLDRTGLILDIFAQRARTHEGKLQVELAQLEHMSTRLIRGWTHLERQKGGIGMRGPGETQLETDRRLLRVRIRAIHRRLDKVRKQREQGRRARARTQTPTLSLVGYTNAGKSTLFNTITNATVYVMDQLFATLDPTMRRIELDEIGSAILADTVGFISNLPHRLVESFRATLEEAASADLLLHVIDFVDDERDRNIEQVNVVLKEIGAAEIPVLLIYNKIDLVEGFQPKIGRDASGRPVSVWLSAQNDIGIDLLLSALVELLAHNVVHAQVTLLPEHGRIRAKLYEGNVVLAEIHLPDGGCALEIRIPAIDLKKLLAAEGVDEQTLMLDAVESNWHRLAV